MHFILHMSGHSENGSRLKLKTKVIKLFPLIKFYITMFKFKDMRR